MNYFKIFLSTLFIFLFSSQSYAGLYIHPRIGYHSGTDSQEGQSYNSTYYGSLLGATFGKNNNWVVGINIDQWTKTHKGSSALTQAKITLLEMGPMFSVYLNKAKNLFVSAAYNLHAKGKRTLSSGTAQVISGSSYFAQFGYVVKFSRSVYLGVAMNYHSASISSSVVGNTQTTQSDTYTTIYPSIDLSIRFK